MGKAAPRCKRSGRQSRLQAGPEIGLSANIVVASFREDEPIDIDALGLKPVRQIAAEPCR